MVALLVVLGLATWLGSGSAPKAERHAAVAAQGTVSGTIRTGALPATARAAVASVRSGSATGPVRDLGVFTDEQGSLPPQPRGFYRQFAVTLTGRPTATIVAGADGTLYYRPDQGRSFRQILD